MWILGCVFGVAGIGHRWLIVSALIILFVGWGLKRTKYEIIAMVVIGILGFVYGFSSMQVELTECEFSSLERGIILKRPNYKSSQVSFVAKIKDCFTLVSVTPFADVGRGDNIKLKGGTVQSLSEIKDYSEGYADYLERRRISYTWRYPDVELIKTNTTGGHWASAQIQKLYIALYNRVQELFIEPDASIVLAMLLAEKGMILDDIVQQFRKAGVSHILAISGLHIAIIASLIYVIVSWFPIKSWWRTCLVVVFLWSYVLFIGYPMSAIRAASFISVALVFFRLGKLVSLPTALLLTVASITTIKPEAVFDVGFQLSVSAVIGIFVLLFLGGKGGKIFVQSNKRVVLVGIYRLILVSMGATLGTWPLIAYHFGSVSMIGVLANLLVVPIVPLVLWMVIVAMICSVVWMPGALMFSFVTHLLIKWLLFITQKLSLLPGIFFEDVVISIKVIIIYYTFISLAAVFILWRQKRSWREVWG